MPQNRPILQRSFGEQDDVNIMMEFRFSGSNPSPFTTTHSMTLHLGRAELYQLPYRGRPICISPVELGLWLSRAFRLCDERFHFPWIFKAVTWLCSRIDVYAEGFHRVYRRSHIASGMKAAGEPHSRAGVTAYNSLTE